MNIKKEIQSENGHHFPSWVIYVTILISLAPFFLTLLGFNFGNTPIPFNASLAESMTSQEVTDYMFRSLSGGITHTILEWSAFCTAVFTVILAFIHFGMKQDVVTPILGVALFSAGCMDAFHTLAADRLIDAVADNTNLIPFTWAICRVFNALIMIMGVFLLLFTDKRKIKNNLLFLIFTSLTFGLLAYGIIHFCATSNSLPRTMFPDSIITRPWDIGPLVLYLFAGVYVFPRFYEKNKNYLSHAILISVIPHVATQSYMAFGSTSLFDNYFNVAHFMKILAYLLPFAGLVMEYWKTYNEEKLINENLERVQKELLASRQEADRANRAKTVFLANMSHEIRTPMNAIIGMGDLLAETQLTAEQEQLVNVFRGAGENLLLLINDILDLSKIEAGQIELESIEFEPRQLLEKTVEILGLRAEEKGIELNFYVSPEVPKYLLGDAHRLRQVLTNLVGNAIKFTERGDVLVHVEKDQGTCEAGGLYFSVSDTGVGIPSQKLDNIFTSFSQADTSTTRKHGGTGLGLAITKSLVELMQGQIWVKSELGEGSSFFFTVRFDAQASSGKEKLVIPEKLKKMKALLVENRPSVRSMIKDHMLDWGLWVDDVDCGNMAFEVLQRTKMNDDPYSLLLINSRLPGIGGFRLIEKFKKELDIHLPTLMMMPIDARKGDIKFCEEMGVESYMTKFIRPEHLLGKILGVLDNKKSIPERVVEKETLLKENTSKKEKSLRVLLVEDSEDNRLLIQLYLKKTPHQVDIAENGEVALQKFDPESYDLVLMDMQMPVMDGYTATKLIREMEDLNNLLETPIIALTAHALKGDREKCLDAGCTDYVAKPIKKDRLLEILQSYQKEMANGK